MKKALLTLFSLYYLLSASNLQAQQAGSTVKDSSGKKRTDLPEPYATKSSRNFSEVIGWENNSTPKAPEGFTVTRFGEGYNNPRWIYVLPNGDVLVAETKVEHKGLVKVGAILIGADKQENKSEDMRRILLLRDVDKDGKPDMQTVFLADQNLPFGMVVVRNYFYVACTDAVWRYPYKEGQTTITTKGEKILELPAGERHWTKNIISNKTGTKLYVAIGSASNVGEKGLDKEANRARIIECNLDGTNMKVYASGLRNPVGMDWQPGTDIMWTAVNERDELGDDLVPDYLTSVKEGGFYGWPYSYWGSNKDPRIKEDEQRPDLVSKTLIPEVDLGSHTASLGLAFYTKKKFPAKYMNGAFIGQHGSWNRAVPSGYKVVFVPFDGKKAGKPEDFLTGFMKDESKNEVKGRPVGVAIMNDGSLLVADDAGNCVWRVSYGK
ncbi:L-sorbosone dehydrogenase [Sphingobacteriaceae bacterium]|nr:L-sorbosone dehydrogenase [Sphingobacteriaceae bacterium]